MRILALFSLLLGFSAQAKDKVCNFEMDDDSIKVEWTGYKFTEKTGVTGKFEEVELKSPEKGKTIEEIVGKAQFEIDGLEFDAGNMARNINLSRHFFKKFADEAKITGAVKKMAKGKLDLEITVNGVKKTLPMTYTIEKNKFTANGKMTMADFKLGKAYESIHKACEKLHTGEDGVAKTWKEVDLMASAEFEKECK